MSEPAKGDVMGAWKYTHRTDDVRYGGELSYRKMATFLDGCGPLVEDWGCGGAYAKRFFSKSCYVGLDGSEGRCDRVVDLREYTSQADGILIRHLLEHNYDWPLIVANAAVSFKKRLVIIFFIPTAKFTTNAFNENNGIPNLSIGTTLLLSYFPESRFTLDWEQVVDEETSPHSKEWILCVERK